LFATTLGRALRVQAEQDVNVVLFAIHLVELGLPVVAQACDDLLEPVEHRAVEALAPVLRDEHEVITERVVAVVELVDAHVPRR
jgi:hypothetical protein